MNSNMMSSFIRDCRMGCWRVRGPSHPASRTTPGAVFRRSVLLQRSPATSAGPAGQNVRRTRSPSFGDTGRVRRWARLATQFFLRSRGVASSRGSAAGNVWPGVLQPAVKTTAPTSGALTGEGGVRDLTLNVGVLSAAAFHVTEGPDPGNFYAKYDSRHVQAHVLARVDARLDLAADHCPCFDPSRRDGESTSPVQGH